MKKENGVTDFRGKLLEFISGDVAEVLYMVNVMCYDSKRAYSSNIIPRNGKEEY